ncbi:LysR family transcriptional regulator [Anaerotignum sp.]
MELRNLTTFLKVAETGSFSKAANALRYSQSIMLP